MEIIDAGEPAHAADAAKKGVGRPHGARTGKRILSTVKFRELCIKHGPKALEIIMDIAEHGEPDLARFAAAKFIIERGYGLPDGENTGGAPQIVRVITGVRRDPEFGNSARLASWRNGR
jgi:hypothetical protein